LGSSSSTAGPWCHWWTWQITHLSVTQRSVTWMAQCAWWPTHRSGDTLHPQLRSAAIGRGAEGSRGVGGDCY
jgi:hypothetical protein